MVKGKQKLLITENNQNNTLLEYQSTSKKSRQQINQENYQKNKERLKVRQQINYAKKKQREQEQLNKYYQASSITVLMTFKEYTELSSETRKKWLDFNRTLKDINQGISGIVDIMKLRESTDNLINDYWAIAKSEERQKSKSWNSLDYDEQQRLIKYWGREKARLANNFLTTAERLEREGEQWEKDIGLAKFHEERGKKGCECWQCEARKEIQAEVKEKIKKDIADYDRQNKATDKEQCPECGKLRVLDEETGVCKGCVKKYG